MSSKTIRELANKYADLASEDRDDKFRMQRERLEQFSTNFHMKLRVLLNEMEGDLMVLKEKDFPKELLKSFFKVWYDMIDIAKHVDTQDPYSAAKQLVEYVKQRPHRAIIDNLEYLVQHHMTKTQVDFKTGPLMQHAQIKSLKLLKELANKMDQYMQSNPLMDVPSSTPAEELKDLKVPPSEFKPPSASQQETTYVPPIVKEQSPEEAWDRGKWEP